MALRYFHPGDEDQFAAHAPIGFDEDSDWWVGVQQLAVGIAIAATLAVSASQSIQAENLVNGWDHQDDPAGQLRGQPDEDFWQNPVAPAQNTFQIPQPWQFDVQEPAGNLSGQPDEDYWVNPVAPTQAVLRPFVPWDQEEIPAGSLHGQADEDFWSNPVAPLPASLAWPQPFLFEQNESPTLSGQPDEDYWVNPTPPVIASLLWPQPFIFATSDDAVQLYGQMDEDFWLNPVAPVPPSIYRSPDFIEQDEIPAGDLVGQPDEDYWQNPTPPIVATIYRSPLFVDPEEIPAGNLHGQADEDFWALGPQPAQATIYQTLPYLFDAGEIAYVPPTAPPDEDFAWPIIPSIPSSIWQRLPYLPDGEEIPAGSLYGVPEEDVWQVRATQPTPYIVPQPFSFDAGETVAQPYIVAEDYWQSGVAPTTATSNVWPAPWFDANELPLLSIDEEIWQTFPKYVASIPVRAFTDDQEFVQAPPIQDEDFDWSFLYGPRPVLSYLYQPLPLAGFEDIAYPAHIPDWLALVYSSTTPSLVLDGVATIPAIVAKSFTTTPALVLYSAAVVENETYMSTLLLPLTIQQPFIFFPGNTVPVMCMVILGSTWNTTQTPVTDITGTLTIKDASGNPVTGANGINFVQSLTVPGLYTATINGASFNPPEGSNYTTEIEMTSTGNGPGLWTILTVIRFRTTP